MTNFRVFKNLILFSIFGLVLSDNKVKVTLFFESLCPDSQRFFYDQLGPTFSKIPDVLEADLVPYGNVRIKDNELNCQHGPSECTGNLYHACAIAKSSNDYEAVEWATCISNKSMQSDDWEGMSDCSPKWSEINECAKGDEGTKLIDTYGIRTIKQNIRGTPTALVDGKENKVDLLTAVCNALKAKSMESEACDE